MNTTSNCSETEIKAKIKKSWNAAAAEFDQMPGHGLHNVREKQAWMKLLEESLGPRPQHILDVGTGTGVIALLLAEMGHKVTGIDLAEEMLARAREKAKRANLPVDFKSGDAENLPFEENVFDAVVNRHVLWNMPNPERAVSEWARVVKPGGKLVVIDGDWKNYSGLGTVWKQFAQLLIRITEGRIPDRDHGVRAYENDLPLRYVRRPEADLKILAGFGLQAEARMFKDPRAYSLLNYLKYGYYNRFVVTVNKGA